MGKWQQSVYCHDWREARQAQLPTSGAIQKGVPTEVFLRSLVLVSWAETPATRQSKETWLQIHSHFTTFILSIWKTKSKPVSTAAECLAKVGVNYLSDWFQLAVVFRVYQSWFVFSLMTLSLKPFYSNSKIPLSHKYPRFLFAVLSINGNYQNYNLTLKLLFQKCTAWTPQTVNLFISSTKHLCICLNLSLMRKAQKLKLTLQLVLRELNTYLKQNISFRALLTGAGLLKHNWKKPQKNELECNQTMLTNQNELWQQIFSALVNI